MQQSRNYKRDSQSECKQALEIWPESGASRVSAYREAVSLVVAQDAANTAWSPIPAHIAGIGVSPVVGLSQVQVSRIRSVNGAGYDGSTAREGRNE